VFVKLGSRSGQSAVEFALVLPLIMLAIFGAVELGVATYDKAVLTNASREGVRAGIVAMTPRLTDAQIQSVVTTYAQNNMITFKNPGSVTATVTPAYATRNATGSSGTVVTVMASYGYNFFLIPKFLTSFMGTITLRGLTVMRME
jgi:Flp pilus assembly protein TadG